MPDIFQSFVIQPEDNREERMKKLYLGIISVGEDLYCKGAHLAELNKQITAMEKDVATMRQELNKLRATRGDKRKNVPLGTKG